MEVIKNNYALRWTLFLMRWLPKPFIYFIVYFATFFFYIFAKYQRENALLFQRRLFSFSNGVVPKKISPYRQLLSFSMGVVEKMYGWLGETEKQSTPITYYDDDVKTLVNLLENKKGAILIASHLGNVELLRSLSFFGKTATGGPIPVTIIAEIDAAEVYNTMLRSINPAWNVNLVNAEDINIGTIESLQNCLDGGGLVVYTGDRVNRKKSGKKEARVIKKDFLGQQASFPYGVFLLTTLLNSPAFFVFGIRKKICTLHPAYDMFVERVKTPLNSSKRARDSTVQELCGEYVETLQRYCLRYPYQWHNFYNFWE